MTTLPTITDADVGGATIPTANARDLHRSLGIGRDFTTWIKGRIRELLTGAEVDEATLARAERTRNECNGSLAGTENALAELVECLDAVESTLAAEDARIERERLAEQHADDVRDLSDATTAMLNAATALAECFGRFRRAAYAAMPATEENPLGPSEVIGRVRGHLLHEVFPQAFEPPILSTAANAAAEAFTTVEQLRRRVEGIRLGNVVALRPPALYASAPTFSEVPIAQSPGTYRHLLCRSTQSLRSGAQDWILLL